MCGMCCGRALAFLFVCGLSLLLSGCGDPEPIRLGFAGQLTGARADLGVQGRDGAMLALEDVNAAGGVAGRKLKLIVRDDLGTPEGAEKAEKELIAQHVAAIIGHMTSSQTIAGLPTANAAEIVLLSPTTSTSELSGKKDFFFRVQPTTTASAACIAHRAGKELGLRRVALVYDSDNAAYSRVYKKAFTKAFAKTGGEIVSEVAFSSAGNPDYRFTASRLLEDAPQGVLFIVPAVDTAFLAQKIRAARPDLKLLSSGWAVTDALLRNGGRAVNGLESIGHFDSGDDDPRHRDFQQRFRERFGKEPTFAASQAYEAVQVLAEALKLTKGASRGLDKALLAAKDFKGLHGLIRMDEFGDVIRSQYLVVVEDGRFVTKRKYSPAFE